MTAPDPTPPAAGSRAGRQRPAPARRRSFATQWLPSIGLGMGLAYLTLVPLAMLLWSSVTPTGLPTEGGFTWEHYARVYGDPHTFDLAFNSVMFAAGSTAVALVVGTVLAWLTERTDLPARGLVRAAVILPMAVPPVLLAIAWVLLASPEIGAFNGVFRALGLGAPLNVYSMPGMIFVQGLALVPTAYLITGPAFANMDPTLEEAAAASGAAPGRVVRRIVLPLMRPALLAAAAFLLILGFVVFDIPGVLGLPADIYVLSSEIFFRAHPPAGLPDYGGISALAVSFLMLLLGLAWVYRRQTGRAARFATVGGKATKAKPFPLGRWRWPAAGLAWLYILLAAVAPFAVLLLTSFAPYYQGVSADLFGALTLRNHVELWSNPAVGRAVWHSLVVAVLSATAVTALSALVSWVSIRSHRPGRRWFDIMAFIPVAIPSVMVGLALIYVYLTLRFIPVYGTIWMLIAAYLTTYLSFGTRVTNSALTQIAPDLEDAARTSGAGFPRRFRRITLPLLRPALVSVWIWVAAHALRELSTALLLQGRDNTVIPTVLWGYWESGRPTTAAAAGVWLVVALAVLVGAWGWVARRGGPGQARVDGP